MALYHFSISRRVNGMNQNSFIDLELSEDEARSIRNDDANYSKVSALASRKLGESVKANAFPTKLSAEKSINEV
jgi:hypothetical protein